MLKRIHSKKGFTLAELLIVVAIIAILVAIALPLFFGALDSARNATFEANKRAVKAAAVVKILQDEDVTAKFDASTHKAYATATVDDKGDIGEITIDTTGTETPDYATWKSKANANKITVELTLTDIEDAG